MSARSALKIVTGYGANARNFLDLGANARNPAAMANARNLGGASPMVGQITVIGPGGSVITCNYGGNYITAVITVIWAHGSGAQLACLRGTQPQAPNIDVITQ